MMGSIANLLGLGHDTEALIAKAEAMLEQHSNTVQHQLDEWFTYHAPTGDQQERYEALRAAAKAFAQAIVEHVPACADRTAALRKVREANMTANAAIACGGV